MPIAWFWRVVARIMQDPLCHLHGLGHRFLKPFAWVLVRCCYNSAGCRMPFAWFWVVVARILQDVLCHLHGFGESWLELCRMPDAICMVLASRG